jgi:hypothetical protein
MIPKPGGGERPLGIPTIRDRVIQTAVKLLIEPIFEADLEPNAYGYRPKRSEQAAIQEVHEALCEGYTDVVDADLSKYFDTIPHSELLQCVARRIVDKHILHLLKMWLKAPVEETDEKGKKRLTGGKGKSRHSARGSGQSTARKSLHEPDVEGLEQNQTGRAIPGQTGQLRRRCCDSQSRSRGGGTGLDAGGGHAAGAHSE